MAKSALQKFLMIEKEMNCFEVIGGQGAHHLCLRSLALLVIKGLLLESRLQKRAQRVKQLFPNVNSTFEIIWPKKDGTYSNIRNNQFFQRRVYPESMEKHSFVSLMMRVIMAHSKVRGKKCVVCVKGKLDHVHMYPISGTLWSS